MKMNLPSRVGLLLFLLLLASQPAFARRFEFKDVTLGTYFKGTYGPSQVLDSPYGKSSGTGTTFDKKIETNYSGEFGVALAADAFTLRFAAELLMPRHLTDVKGQDAAGAELFNLDTNTSALIPWAYLDINLLNGSIGKLYAGAGAGYAYVKMENKYTFTDAGTAAFGKADYVEKGETQAIAAAFYTGFELHFADNTTLLMDAGYRYLPIRSLNHLKAANTLVGDVARGDPMLKHDGGQREVDFSGPYVGLAFRFYINM